MVQVLMHLEAPSIVACNLGGEVHSWSFKIDFTQKQLENVVNKNDEFYLQAQLDESKENKQKTENKAKENEQLATYLKEHMDSFQ